MTGTQKTEFVKVSKIEHVLKLCAIVLFFAILLLPSFGSLLNIETNNTEKRQLAPYPELLDDDDSPNLSFFSQWDAWYQDHFGLRGGFVFLNSWLRVNILHTSPSEKVIVGGGDGETWFFFHETIPDYIGINPLTEDEIETIKSNLESISEAAGGRPVIFAMVPNKNEVYPRYMPVSYKKSDNPTSLDVLYEALSDIPNLTCADLGLERAADTEVALYYATDTHWNARGARIGALAIKGALEKQGITLGDIPELPGGEQPFMDGDLASGMLAMGGNDSGPVMPDMNYSVDGTLEDMYATTYGEGSGRLLVLRDSFGACIGPWLGHATEESRFVWTTPLDCSELERYDAIVILLSQRSIRQYALPEPVVEYALDDDEPEINTDDLIRR